MKNGPGGPIVDDEAVEYFQEPADGRLCRVFGVYRQQPGQSENLIWLWNKIF